MRAAADILRPLQISADFKNCHFTKVSFYFKTVSIYLTKRRFLIISRKQGDRRSNNHDTNGPVK